MHPPRGLELADAANVRGAPVASLGARGEPVGVDLIRDSIPDAVDPPEAEGLVDRFGIADRLLGDTLLVVADPRFALAGVVLLEPISEFSGRHEDLHILRIRRLHHPPAS